MAEFLATTDVRRWYENTGRGSRITADVYARSLRLFCHLTDSEPLSLVQLKEAELHGLLLRFVTAEESRKQAGSSTATHLKAVKSWLSFNGVRVTRPVKVRHAQETPTLVDERTPSQPELRRILLAATARNRVSCALMAFSGVRPEVLGSYLGDDGLRVKDLPDLRIDGTEVRFDRTPAMVVVRSNLSKAGHRYFTFLGEEGCGYLVEYLRMRAAGGEMLTPESDLIHPEAGHSTKRGIDAFLRTINVSDGVRLAIRKAGLRARPYVLRAYFDTQLLLSESKGKVAHDYRVFWMGHKGSMEARYTTNKSRLPAELLEDMRESYQRCEQFLGTSAPANRDTSNAEAYRVILSPYYTDEQIAKIDLTDVGAVTEALRKGTSKTASSSDPKQRVIPEAELPSYLAEGWIAKMPVNGSKFIVERP